MVVKCIANSGEYLKQLNKLPQNTFEGIIFEMLNIGQAYPVLAIVFNSGTFTYLLDVGRPIDLPNELFKIEDHSLNSSMVCGILPKGDSYTTDLFIIGYPEIVLDYNHYYNLIDGQEKENIIFFKRSQEFRHEFEKIEKQLLM